MVYCVYVRVFAFPFRFYLFMYGRAGSSLLCRLSLVVAGGGSSVAEHSLLIAVACLVAEQGPWSAQVSGAATLRLCCC